MGNNNYEMYNLYYNQALKAQKEGANVEVVIANLKGAAQYAIKIAKDSRDKIISEHFLSYAEYILKRIKEIEATASRKQCSNFVENDFQVNNGAAFEKDISDSKEAPEELEPVEDVTLEEALEELNSLEGLASVKKEVTRLTRAIQGNMIEQNAGYKDQISCHMVFTGNAGTGKTTVARILGKIFKALGILKKGHLVEVSRSDLVAEYIGGTSIKAQKCITKALDGVLFIDEAHTLKKPDDEKDFGQEAIDVLNKMMEDYRHRLVVIVAGYKDEMKKMIASNQGLDSRFTQFINFEDYSGEELFKIFQNMCTSSSGRERYLSKDAEDMVKEYLMNVKLSGNARSVRKIYEDIVLNHKARLPFSKDKSKEVIETLTVDDLPIQVREFQVESLTVDVIKPIKKEDDSSSMGNRMINDSNLENKKVEDIGITNNLGNDIVAPDVKDVLKNSYNKTQMAQPEEDDVAEEEFDFKYDWDSLPIVNFEDIAGLENVKDIIRTKVILPLVHPTVFDGYKKRNGGGLFLYGPPGTGKTMIAAAIANEVGAKFCEVKPSDLLSQGAGNTEKNVKELFEEARRFKCSIIYFDEMESMTPKTTRSQYARQLRSQLLSELNGIESYSKESDNILFVIGSTNKPWDVDDTFLRPGRFGSLVYVGLPDFEARKYIIQHRFEQIKEAGQVIVDSNIDIDVIAESTEGYNGSDISNVLDRASEISALRGLASHEKRITVEDINRALDEISSTVQKETLVKLKEWKRENNG